MRKLLLFMIAGVFGLTGAGCPLSLLPNPTLVSATLTGTAGQPAAKLSVRVPDPLGTAREVVFYGRPHVTPGEDFTIVLLPDTQGYSERFPEAFLAQTQWIVDNRDELNIAAVLHLGDIVEVASVETEWDAADAAIGILDTVPDLPYGLGVGNHDQTPNGNPDGTQNFNRFFPFARYEGVVPWYGGHFGNDNDNHYILFSAGGLDFVAVFLEFDRSANTDVLDWSNQVLETHADRRAIVVTHFTMIGQNLANRFSPQGRATFDALKQNSNLFLMLGGHFCEVGRRSDVVDGREIHSLLADYQCRPDGGQGWLRLLRFSPADNTIDVQTYSPTLDEFLTDASQDFSLAYEMQDDQPFSEFASVQLEPGEELAEVTWDGLEPGTAYDWFVSVSGGLVTTTGETWTVETR